MKIENNLRKCIVSFALGFVFLAGPAPVRATTNLVFNGGFEQGDPGWSQCYYYGLSCGYDNAPDGRNYACVYDKLYQDLPTVPGQQYHVRFAMAGNFNISAPSALDVVWGGSSVGNVSWDPAGHSISDLGWIWSDFEVTAKASSTRLSFDNPFAFDGSQRDFLIDAISATAVPEPSSLVLLGLGALAVRKGKNR